MKPVYYIVAMGTVTCLLNATAQDRGDQQDPPSGGGGKPPSPPIEAALDSNGNGTIDADEITNAAVALKTLDKNGDGKLTADEYRSAMPPRGGGARP